MVRTLTEGCLLISVRILKKKKTNANPKQLTDNRPKVKFSPKVNTLQCEKVDIEYMIDDENFVACILDAGKVYQM